MRLRPLFVACAWWVACAWVVAARSGAAAEQPVATPPPRETRPVSGVPLDVADELIGIADHAVVSVAWTTYVLPTASDRAALTTCTIFIDGAAGAHLEWSLDLAKHPVIDGIMQPRWSGQPIPEGALHTWRDRMRTLTPPGTSCASAVAALRSALTWRKPRRKHAAFDEGDYALRQEWGLDRVVTFEGPDAHSVLAAGYRGSSAWRFRVVPATEPLP